VGAGDRTLGVAVIGAGFGRHVVIPAFRSVPGFQVSAVVSGSATRAGDVARELGVPHAFAAQRLEEALALPGLELVFVASPPAAHREQSTRALAAGKHVVCEKPMALDAGEAAAMVEAARAARRLGVVDHELRFSPTRRRLRDLVQEDFLGRLLHADIAVQGEYRLDRSRPWSWWSDADQGGGFLGALGSHVIDAVRFTLGEVAAACGCLRTLVRERPDPVTGRPRAVSSDDYALFWLRLEGGATVAASLSALARTPRDAWRFSAHGEKGSLVLDEEERLWGRREGEAEYRDLTPADQGRSVAALGLRDTAWTRAFVRFAGDLQGALAEGRITLPHAASFQDGLRVQQVMDAIRESSRRERWVACGPTAQARGAG
jgi:predicted dehydrogenase